MHTSIHLTSPRLRKILSMIGSDNHLDADFSNMLLRRAAGREDKDRRS